MNGEDVLQRADAAFQIQMAHVSLWREAISYSLPRKMMSFDAHSSGLGSENRQPYVPDPKLQNSVSAKGLRDLSSGMGSAFMNPSEAWFELEPAEDLPNPTGVAKAYFSRATRILLRLLGPSGFYSRIKEAIGDAIATGTTALNVEGPKPGSSSPLNFETWDIGSYAIAENAAGIVDRVWRNIEYTVQQAQQAWPDFHHKAWEKLQEHQKLTKTSVFVLEIKPRKEEDVGQKPGWRGMPYQGTVVHRESKEVVWEGGWPEFPVRVYRFDKQSSVNPWGTGPGIECLPDARATNWLETVIADGVGKAVEPPLALKSDMRGILDARMGGFAMVESMEDAPRPLFQVGNIQFATAFLTEKKRELREHFYSDLFTPFLNDTRTLKAAQVYEIKSDVLNIFAPFGHRFLEELASPVIERMFMVCLRQNLFGPVPRELLTNVNGNLIFLYPKIVHQSRMAIELRNLAQQAARQFLGDMVNLGTVAPASLDYLNYPKLATLFGANSVLMPDVIRTEDEVAQIRAAQAKAAQDQMLMENAAKFATKNPEMALAAAGAA